uniref:Thioredoxin-like fold domain-containing protein n=1 Tax=Ignisphaera aggregans TaxID=334771 RepID=A0A7C4FHK3_9CREN
MTMKKVLVVIILIVVISSIIYSLTREMFNRGTQSIASYTTTSTRCSINNNTFFVVYLSVPPTESLFLAISKNISRSILHDTNGAVNITFSLCIVRYNDLDDNVRSILVNRSVFPISGFYTTINLTNIETVKRLFNVFESYYIIKEELIPTIYIEYMRDLYIRYRGVIIPIYNVPKVLILAETLKPPKIYINETPVIGSLNSKYYMIIYEDVYCLACAYFYNETLPKLEELIRNNTFALILKTFIVHEGALPIHRNITALYIVTRNSTAVLETMKAMYSQLIKGIKPKPEEIAETIKDTTKININTEVINKIIEEGIIEARNYGIFATPGFIIWNRELGRGIVIVGNNRLEDVLNIIVEYLR